MILITKKKNTLHWMRYLLKFILLLMAAAFITPILMALFHSVIHDGRISLNGYKDLFFDCFVFYRLFWNSVLYSCIITILQLSINILAAFGLHFCKFKGKNLLFMLYIILMMMPLQVMILPNYLGLRDMNLIDTELAIILPLLFSPLSLVVLYQYMREINLDIIEAVRLETNSIGKILYFALLPQIRICIYAVALFIFAECWSLVEQPMLFIRQYQLKTLTIFLSETDKYSNTILLSASVIFMVPVLLFYMFFHDELEKGLKFL